MYQNKYQIANILFIDSWDSMWFFINIASYSIEDSNMIGLPSFSLGSMPTSDTLCLH